MFPKIPGKIIKKFKNYKNSNLHDLINRFNFLLFLNENLLFFVLKFYYLVTLFFENYLIKNLKEKQFLFYCH
jgi:hypothetical protein